MRSKIVSRTCGSVRSSLSAPARLAPVGSEAAETTSLHRRDEETAVWWVMVVEPEGCLKLPDAVGKICARLVPLLPNLQTRLAKIVFRRMRPRTVGEFTGQAHIVGSDPNPVWMIPVGANGVTGKIFSGGGGEFRAVRINKRPAIFLRLVELNWN